MARKIEGRKYVYVKNPKTGKWVKFKKLRSGKLKIVDVVNKPPKRRKKR